MSCIVDNVNRTEVITEMKCKIKEYRELKQMTQEELAGKAKVSRYLISQLENGYDVNITKRTMLSIADALGASVTEIFLF